MLTTKELMKWREHLLKLRDRLDKEAADTRSEAMKSSGGESGGGLSEQPLHLADIASQEAELIATIGAAENEANLVREVEDALDRIREKRFGICEGCGKAITKGRLQAIPYARQCIHCAQGNSQS
jgi:DnaK suppressor protein